VKVSIKLFWAILWALFPPTPLILIFYYAIKPAITGKIPEDEKYVYWIISLIIMGAILNFPLLMTEEILAALKNTGFGILVLSLDASVSLMGIGLVWLTFRKSQKPNPYLPFTKFKLDFKLLLFFAISCSPLVMIFMLDIIEDPNELMHPLLIAFHSSVSANSLVGIFMGFLAIVIFGPIFEEIVFRGLLLEPNHEKTRSKFTIRALDFFSCLFFAIVHFPISFILPFLFAAITIYVRRLTNSIYPPIIMHCTWNFCVLVPIVLHIKR